MFNSRNRCLFFELTIFMLFILGFVMDHLLSVAAQDQHTSTADYGSQMVQYTRQGRSDEAIETGLTSLRNQPKDTSVYRQIIVVYLIRAKKDPTTRDQCTLQSIRYAERTLSAY